MVIPSDGKPIILNKKDDIFAMKEGGVIMEALKPSTQVNKTFSNVEEKRSNIYVGGEQKMNGNINLNVNGSIDLRTPSGNVGKIDVKELLKDQQFIRELTRIIGNQMNRDINGGKFMGGLVNEALY